jgi:hypothetical protein
MVAMGDLGAGDGDAIRLLVHHGHHFAEAGLHVGQGVHQCCDFILPFGAECAAQIAVEDDGIRNGYRLAQRQNDVLSPRQAKQDGKRQAR